MATIGSVKKRVASLRRWLEVLEDGLNGKPHSLGDGEGGYFQKYVAGLGMELVSLTAATKRGLVLRRGVKPICSRYYPRPISAHHPLYLIEQFKPKESSATHTQPN